MTPDTTPFRNFLPEGLTAYKRTPMFDQGNLPIGLRREHRTRGCIARMYVYEERLSGSQAPLLYAISLTIVFLCLAAPYESFVGDIGEAFLCRAVL